MVYWSKRQKLFKDKASNYDQNDGVPGVVYILTNKSLAWNSVKIGCSRHSGYKRAEDLNRDAGTGVPALYKCFFQQETVDCGIAEKRVFEKLKDYRIKTEKEKQEFFKIEMKLAIKTVKEECQKVDQEYKERETKSLMQKLKTLGTRYMLGRYAELKRMEKQN